MLRNQILKLSGSSPLVIACRGCFQRRTRGRKIPVRKPIYFPTAPSKLFRIREKPFFAEDEREQFEALEAHYDNAMRSTKEFLHVEVYLPSITAGGFGAEEVEKEVAEQERLLKENEEENNRQRQRREAKTAWIQEQLEKDAMSEEAERLMAEEEEKDLITETVKKEIERSTTYITKDSLEDAILRALDCPVNYEFAIDLEGKIIFEEKLHPYALDPSSIPETSDQELDKFVGKNTEIKLKERKVLR